MKKCPSCNKMYRDKYSFCPNCGISLDYVEKKLMGIEELSKSDLKQINPNESIFDDTDNSLMMRDHISIILKYLTICLGWIIIVLPFFITGFSFGFFWYLLIIATALIMLSLYGLDVKKTDRKHVVGVLFIYFVIFLLMIIWGPINVNYK